jgi:hypothetical protein
MYAVTDLGPAAISSAGQDGAQYCFWYGTKGALQLPFIVNKSKKLVTKSREIGLDLFMLVINELYIRYRRKE